MIAVPTVTQVKIRPTTISPVVPSGLFSTKVLMVAIVVAASVPPTQIGLDSQYSTAVIDPASRPNDIFTHSYGPPSTGKAEPSSATSIPYGIRNTTSEMSSQVIAWAPASAAKATLSRPTMAQAVNKIRSHRDRTFRSLAFSCATSTPWATSVMRTNP